jgi:hypothetical protein
LGVHRGFLVHRFQRFGHLTGDRQGVADGRTARAKAGVRELLQHDEAEVRSHPVGMLIATGVNVARCAKLTAHCAGQTRGQHLIDVPPVVRAAPDDHLLVHRRSAHKAQILS